MLDISTKVKSLETPNYSFSRSIPKHWFLDWPLYIILGISAFFHFFRIQTTEFDFDQANLFQLAHDAIAHGLIPLSSNQASIGVLHAPFFIYTLLPAAALSSNPLGGAITVALFTTAAAAFAYWFTYRYFGRLPAIVAGLLNATAYVPLKYSAEWQTCIDSRCRLERRRRRKISTTAEEKCSKEQEDGPPKSASGSDAREDVDPIERAL